MFSKIVGKEDDLKNNYIPKKTLYHQQSFFIAKKIHYLLNYLL